MSLFVFPVRKTREELEAEGARVAFRLYRTMTAVALFAFARRYADVLEGRS